jgi:cell division septal protein FtsQ
VIKKRKRERERERERERKKKERERKRESQLKQQCLYFVSAYIAICLSLSKKLSKI